MKAFILAAGRGRRLWPHTANRPKCLLDVGGITLLERQLFQLKEAGITETIVVGGFRMDSLTSTIDRSGIANIRLVYNPFFAHSDNLISLWLARSYMDGPQILLNGDIIFSPDALSDLISHESPCSLLTQKKTSYLADDMKIIARGSRITKIGKDLSCAHANAISLGLLSFEETAVKVLRNSLEEIVRSEKSLTSHFPAVIQHMIDAGHSVCAHEVPAFNCSDVDTIADLELIREEWHRYYPTSQTRLAGI